MSGGLDQAKVKRFQDLLNKADAGGQAAAPAAAGGAAPAAAGGGGGVGLYGLSTSGAGGGGSYAGTSGSNGGVGGGAAPAGSTYKIKPGDNLTKIAKANGTTVDAIMKANPQIKDPNKIQAGASLTLPGGAQGSGQPARRGGTASELRGTPQNQNMAGTRATLKPDEIKAAQAALKDPSVSAKDKEYYKQLLANQKPQSESAEISRLRSMLEELDKPVQVSEAFPLAIPALAAGGRAVAPYIARGAGSLKNLFKGKADKGGAATSATQKRVDPTLDNIPVSSAAGKPRVSVDQAQKLGIVKPSTSPSATGAAVSPSATTVAKPPTTPPNFSQGGYGKPNINAPVSTVPKAPGSAIPSGAKTAAPAAATAATTAATTATKTAAPAAATAATTATKTAAPAAATASKGMSTVNKLATGANIAGAAYGISQLVGDKDEKPAQASGSPAPTNKPAAGGSPSQGVSSLDKKELDELDAIARELSNSMDPVAVELMGQYNVIRKKLGAATPVPGEME